MASYTRSLEDLRLEDVSLVGGKTASLGEMLSALRPLGIEGSVREELLTFLGTLDAGVRWNLTIKFGDARTVVLDEAKQRNTDLLALGTKGRTGLARVLVGSVAEGVIRGAECDVLVARLPEVRR